MPIKTIRTALVSVYDKSGLAPLLSAMHDAGVQFISTGGTKSFIESLGLPCVAVESLTHFPEMLDGRVKTLHPAVHGGILARRTPDHLEQLSAHGIQTIDCVIVDLYPFEDTLSQTTDEDAIIEKIDIGGIALIRAAAKNYHNVVCVASKLAYDTLLTIIEEQGNETSLAQRRQLAQHAFAISSHYDTAIHNWLQETATDTPTPVFKKSILDGTPLRYGENPHQKAFFYGRFNELFETLNGKQLSYNNLVDVDSAVALIQEFDPRIPTFAILKHTNACGVASAPTLIEAWQSALKADPVSAFGGILITNSRIDVATAAAINELFYEVLIAPAYDHDALELLKTKKQRILLRQKSKLVPTRTFRSLLNGVIEQDYDHVTEQIADLRVVTHAVPTESALHDLVFAIKCVKHLKSNGIAIVKDGRLLTMGCGQTSRVDALRHAIDKAQAFGNDIREAVMASEAFFPFSDCVEIAHQAGIVAVAQPGGSVRDQDSIDYCNQHGLAMVLTGIRHFKH